MLQAVANRDRGRTPSIGSGVYTIDHRAKLILHMKIYDRGLDIIAADISTLVPVYELYADWIFSYQRRNTFS